MKALVALALVTAAPPIALVPLATKRVEHCERAAIIRPACPRLVPRVRATYLSHLSPRRGSRGAAIFSLERGGEYPNASERNRPPRMAHLVIVAGDVEYAAAFGYPARATMLRNGLMRRERPKALFFGPRRFGRLDGRLYLGPAYPRGGMLGNHLVFRWEEGRTEYAVTLHAWEPLREAEEALRRIVASTPAASGA